MDNDHIKIDGKEICMAYEILTLNRTIKEKESEINRLSKENEELKRKHASMLCEHCDCVSGQKYEDLQTELGQKENIINQIDDILKELFGVTLEICETKEDFDGFKRFLRSKIESSSVANLIPEEPIKVADMLINLETEVELAPFQKAIMGKNASTFPIFDVSELRQIAEHLLIYCNAYEKEN